MTAWGDAGDTSLEGLWARARWLAAERRYADAVAEWDRVIEHYGDDDEVISAQALGGKCWCLYRLRDSDRFPAAVDELCDHYENAEDPRLRIASGYGLQLKAWWLLHGCRGREAIAISEQLAARFATETDATARSRLGEMLFSVATGLSWGGRSRCERLLTVTLIAEPALAYGASKLRGVGVPAASGVASYRSGGVGAAHRCIAAREVLRDRMERSLDMYDLVLEEPASGEERGLATLRVRAQLNRGAALITLGRLRTGRAALDPLFELSSAQFANAIRTAPPQPYDWFDSTDVSIAMLTNASSASDREARAAAKELLRHYSTHADSRAQRLIARMALITGQRH